MTIINITICHDYYLDEEDEDSSDPMMLASKYDLQARSAATDASVKAHVPVPTQAEIGAIVVDEKKRLLLEKFNMMWQVCSLISYSPFYSCLVVSF